MAGKRFLPRRDSIWHVDPRSRWIWDRSRSRWSTRGSCSTRNSYGRGYRGRHPRFSRRVCRFRRAWWPRPAPRNRQPRKTSCTRGRSASQSSGPSPSPRDRVPDPWSRPGAPASSRTHYPRGLTRRSPRAAPGHADRLAGSPRSPGSVR